jgi:hypothetical protein
MLSSIAMAIWCIIDPKTYVAGFAKKVRHFTAVLAGLLSAIQPMVGRHA